MAKVCVIIPYFQRAPGILRRALASAFEQETPPGVSVEIIVIDDQSPCPPEPETLGLSRQGYTVRILRQPNGGPARARNSGLAAAEGADAIAFLDSDDAWARGHLARALEALAAGAQFYFANNWYDETHTWFEGLRGAGPLRAAATALAQNTQIETLSSADFMPLLAEECLPHTSAVVYNARALPGARFEEDQMIAGEDHLFWLTLAAKAQRIAFTAEPMSTRGRGVDLYRAALDWDHPDCIRRLYFKLNLHKKIRDRFLHESAARARAQAQIIALRRGVVYLLMRNAGRHWRQTCEVLGALAGADPAFYLTLPANALAVIFGKARGTFEFPRG